MTRIIAWTGAGALAVVIFIAAATAAIITAITGSTTPTACTGTSCQPPPITAAGWTRPVPGGIVSGFRPPNRPGHDGVDLDAPRGTTIRAVSPGVVVKVACNARNPSGTPRSCDIDGSPQVKGCGWYTEIRHPHDVVTRYCHMLARPSVHRGQTVAAGTPIGLVGSSGNSSGPHLHFELHLGHPATTANATNPQLYLAARGIRL